MFIIFVYLTVLDKLETFLTVSEKQRIILRELQLIRAKTEETFIPGLEKIHTYHGEAISMQVLCV